MNNSVRWRLGVVASAIALLGSFAGLEAHALGLGRITVQSALGEPLRAEIDISEISADEAATLKAGVASPDAFKAAGLDYSTAVVEMQVSLQKRADGRSYLRLRSARAVTEPFVDLILEANWSSGRIVRDYTMLFDPPNLRQSGNAGIVAPTAPMIPRQAAPAAPSASPLGSIPYSPPASGQTRPPPPAPVARVAPPKAGAPAKAATSGQQIAVKAGDTAGKIAAETKPSSISLDQMLVALLRSNPNAFIGGNINRLKSGVVLEIPGTGEASSVTPVEATRTIIAQSRDFNDFRRKLAEGVTPAQAGAANRQAGGKIEAKVEDRAPATATPDKLTLSKGALLSKAAAEDKIAKERQAKEASARVAELSKNIGDLNKLASPPASAASATKAPGVAVTPTQAVASAPKTAAGTIPAVTVAGSIPATPAPTVPAVTETKSASASTTANITASTSTSTTALASTSAAVSSAASAPAASVNPPSGVASQPVAASSGAASAAQAAPVKKPLAAPPPEPSLIDELTENPFVLPGFAALLLLLAGFGFYRFRQRNNATQVDSSFLESRLQPDSFFGASGGQRIDTNEGGATGSSLVYSPSQLDAAGDVDPVAEADVYLAYGRDLQAEEILKEALRTNPTRVSIHSKLMEIYAKRRDAKAFEVVAMEAFNLTRGEGPEWAYMGEMGRELDPATPMYQPGGHPASAADRRNPTGAPEAAAAFGSSTVPQAMQAQSEEQSAAVDFDLDLDFSIDEPIVAAPAAAPVRQPSPTLQPPEPTLAMKPAAAPVFEGLDLDFGIATVALKPAVSAPIQASTQVKDADEVFSGGGLTFTTEPVAASRPAPALPPAPAVMDNGMLEFDLGSLSLDLDEPITESSAITAAGALGGDGPLETKFALAEEFRTLGDMDGARALAEEVLAQAQGSLKGKAQAFLNALS